MEFDANDFRQRMTSKGYNSSVIEKEIQRRLASQQAPQAVTSGALTGEQALSAIGGLGSPGSEAVLKSIEGLSGGAKPETENVVNQLQNLFFGTGTGDSLAQANEGFGGRIPGTALKAKTAISPGGPGSSQEKLNTYIRTLESVRPQLAKAAGDAGNIALAEQIQAGKGLPQPTDTPTEAIEIMQSTREKFGLERSPELDALKEQIIAEQGGNVEGDIAQSSLESDGITSQKASELADRGFLQDLTSFEGLKSYAQEAPGAVAQGILKTGQNILDLTKGDIESIKQRNEEFTPEIEKIKDLDKAAKEEVSSKVQTVVGLMALKNFLGNTVFNKIKSVPPKDAKAVVQEGMKMVKDGQSIRNAGIEQAESAGNKVDGTKVFGTIKKMTDDAISIAKGSQKKEMADFVQQANRKLNGKSINPSTAKRLWDVADDGYSAAGKAGKTIEAAYHRAVRSAIRENLDEVTGGAFEQGTTLIREGLSKNRILQSLGKSLERQTAKQAIEGTPSAVGKFVKGTASNVGKGVAGGLGLAAVAKLLGVQFPGAAYSAD